MIRMRYAISAARSPRPSSTLPAAGRVSSADPVLRVQHQLTDRDLLLLDWLADHQVLTTPQITTALFGSPDLAHRRLLVLQRLGLIDRFRPLRAGGGSHPWRHVLGPLGAQVIAATRGEPTPRPGATTARIRRIAASRTLDHLLGINGFFTDLAGHARTHPGHTLDRWWPETRCATAGVFGTGLITPIRPDGHGIYTHQTSDGQRQTCFLLEWDTGSESLPVLIGKLARYTTHVERGGPAWPVLIRLPDPTREQNLHIHLPDLHLPLPVATTTADRLHHAGPAGPIWHLHRTPGRLCTLLDLNPADH
jgi:Replication-relaxation